MSPSVRTDHGDERIAELFWRLCGEEELFPRSLERHIALAVPLTIVKLPKLRIAGVESWLVRRGVPVCFGCEDRSLRGCLVANRGQGVVFVDGADPEDERRLTLAHELAHFLADYWLPRLIAVKSLGAGITNVLDGLRPATVLERVQSTFVSASLHVNLNFMERRDGVGDVRLWNTESRADRVALALLAPANAVLSRVPNKRRHSDIMPEVAVLLRNEFGLPGWLVENYARKLVARWGRQVTWADSLRQKSSL